MRIRIFSLAVICLFLLLILGLLNLELVRGRKYQELSQRNCIRLIPQVGSRGMIFDCNGQLIVGSSLSYDVMVLPQDAFQLDITLAGISKFFGVKLEDLIKKYKKGYIAPSIPVALVENIDVKKAIALEEVKTDFPGLVVQLHPARFYPNGKLACHILGYLNEIDRSRLTKLADYGYKTKDIVGFGGVEEKYDFYLRQEEGGVSVEVDHRGKFVRMLGYRPPQSGKDIQLTIDLKVQKIAEEFLAERTGSVIIMDAGCGEIIAMASKPGFDPAAFVNKDTASLNSFFNSPKAPLMNRAISGLFPAGSTFKPVVATAALEIGKITTGTTFFCPGFTYVGRKKYNCWDTHGQNNIIGGILHSCNVFFYKTGLLAGAQAIHDYAVKFGFGKPTGIDLPYEMSGFVPDPLWMKLRKFKTWLDGDTANLSIGQGDLMITPIQLARMMDVFATRGHLVTPYIVKAVGGQLISGYQRKITVLPIKETTLDIVRKGLRSVVADPGGTAKVLNIPGVAVAGKTGTVQVPKGEPHGWFVGFFPYEEPRFVICVFLEHGVAGYVSAVVAKQIITKMHEEGLI